MECRNSGGIFFGPQYQPNWGMHSGGMQTGMQEWNTPELAGTESGGFALVT